jgi:hypothetical protein
MAQTSTCSIYILHNIEMNEKKAALVTKS